MTWEITLSQGGTFIRTMTFTDDADAALDTTGWTWLATLKSRATGETVDVGTDATDGGVLTISMDRATTALLTPGSYILAIDYIDASGFSPEQEIQASVRVTQQQAAVEAAP